MADRPNIVRHFNDKPFLGVTLGLIPGTQQMIFVGPGGLTVKLD